MLRLKKRWSSTKLQTGGKGNISKTIHLSEGFLAVLSRFVLVYNKTLFKNKLALNFLPSRLIPLS